MNMLKLIFIGILLSISSLQAAAGPTGTSVEQQAPVSPAPTLPMENPEPFENVEQPVSYQGAFVKMMLTLFALIVFIIISVWLLRRISHGRMKQMNYGKMIKIIERRPLSAKSILYLIEVGGKKVLVSESQLEVRAIASIDEITNL